MFRAVFGVERAKHEAEPDAPDCYGMGSMHARTVALLLVGLVYGTCSLLVGVISLVNLALTRLFRQLPFAFS